MSMPTPFISGKDGTLRLFVNGKETILNAKSWSFSADVTKAEDGVNGEDRSRIFSFVNFFNWSVTGYIDRMSVLDDYLAYVANTDAQVAPYDVAFGIKGKILDGTRKAYIGKEATLDDVSVNQSDRKDRIMYTMSGRARYLESVPTV